ncbi:MAG: thioredoxin domain-containing protein [Chloroflexota bacterium]
MTARKQLAAVQPMTRRERRALERTERVKVKPSARRRGRSSPWRSPIVLSTVGALAVGLAIVVVALLQQPRTSVPGDDLAHPAARVPTGLADGRTLGNAGAPVTIDIWSDFQCPACRKLAVEVEPSIISTFVVDGTTRLVYHDAAFQGQRGSYPAYDEAGEAAAGARCAADQGLFWQMHDWLFANWNGENEGAFAKDRLRAIATSAGVTLTDYDACMAGGEEQSAARAETQQGLVAGITSTPTLIINGRAITGVPTVTQLSALIRDAAEGIVR